MAQSIASLPMYDLPDLREATDAWWAGLAKSFSACGVSNVPEGLTRGDSIDRVWRDKAMLMSQTCGYPLMHGLQDDVKVLGTPVYDAPGCDGPAFSSVIIVRSEDGDATLDDFRGRVAAINSRASQSGYNAFRHAVASLAGGQDFFVEVVVTGSHDQSMAAVRSGKADIATIDCVTFALTQDTQPASTEGLVAIGFTANAPGLPFIVPRDMPDDVFGRLRDGLSMALADPTLELARCKLRLKDVAWLSLSDYQPIVAMEKVARELDYADLV